MGLVRPWSFCLLPDLSWLAIHGGSWVRPVSRGHVGMQFGMVVVAYSPVRVGQPVE
jgi:hypothetical protein